MQENGRLDLIRRLKVKVVYVGLIVAQICALSLREPQKFN